MLKQKQNRAVGLRLYPYTLKKRGLLGNQPKFVPKGKQKIYGTYETCKGF